MLLQAMALDVEEPAVIAAADPVRLDLAVVERGAPMAAARVEQAGPAAEIAEQDQVLSQRPHRERARLQLSRGRGHCDAGRSIRLLDELRPDLPGIVRGPAADALHPAEAARLAETMRGEMVPPEVFDLAARARDEFRKKNFLALSQKVRDNQLAKAAAKEGATPEQKEAGQQFINGMFDRIDEVSGAMLRDASLDIYNAAGLSAATRAMAAYLAANGFAKLEDRAKTCDWARRAADLAPEARAYTALRQEACGS